MNAYTRALRRFWWVVVIGLVVAAGAAYYMVKNETVEYQTSARLLVTSNEGPYIRTSIKLVEELPSDAGDTTPPRTVTRVVDPDVRTLVQAANLYPLLIESDAVAQLRAEMFGDLPGSVTAKAIGATVTVNRFEPGEIPVIEIIGTAPRPRQAIDVTQATAEAFMSWIAQEQDRAGIDEGERILIQELRVPTRAGSSGDKSLALPALVGVAIAIVFGGLAVLLDRFVPRRRSRRGPPEPVLAERIDADEEPIEELTAH